MTETRPGTRELQAIEVTKDGPYHVTGGVPLRRVRKVPGEKKGSFSDWEVYADIETEDEYWLCRCGHSTDKPFCTGMHEKVGFDGTETCPVDKYHERAETLGGTKITVTDDRGICAHAAYCSNATTNIWKASKVIDDDEALSQTVVQMVERCPSGALTYAVDGAPTEPQLEREIWVQEDGPYLLRGGISITRSDGQPIEVRNRMTVCRCGQSANKPLCDGSHAEAGFTDG
jgi:CDGSH-type Zn-finger protein